MVTLILKGLSAVRENVLLPPPNFASIHPTPSPFVISDDDNQNLPAYKTSITETDPRPFLSLQLHSEYRSTYQWHDFKHPPIQSIGGKTSGADAGIVVIKRPPQPLFGEMINLCFVLKSVI